jgi:hypothetical protein
MKNANQVKEKPVVSCQLSVLSLFLRRAVWRVLACGGIFVRENSERMASEDFFLTSLPWLSVAGVLSRIQLPYDTFIHGGFSRLG